MITDQIDFYLLRQASPVAKFRFSCRIANKAYVHGMTVYMQTESEDQSKYLDKLLWTFSQESFVPHTIREGKTDWWKYPVQIGQGNSGADQVDLLIALQSNIPNDYQKYRRIADFVTDDAHEKQTGRARYQVYLNNGFNPKTHQI